jgi:hypothetical protein
MAMEKEEHNKSSAVNGSKHTHSLPIAVNLSRSVSMKFTWNAELKGFISYVTVKTMRLFISWRIFLCFDLSL